MTANSWQAHFPGLRLLWPSPSTPARHRRFCFDQCTRCRGNCSHLSPRCYPSDVVVERFLFLFDQDTMRGGPLTEMQRTALRGWNKFAYLLARIPPHTLFTEDPSYNMLHLAFQAFGDYFFCGVLRKENRVTIDWTDIPPKRSRYGETAYWPNDDT